MNHPRIAETVTAVALGCLLALGGARPSVAAPLEDDPPATITVRLWHSTPPSTDWLVSGDPLAYLAIAAVTIVPVVIVVAAVGLVVETVRRRRAREAGR